MNSASIPRFGRSLSSQTSTPDGESDSRDTLAELTLSIPSITIMSNVDPFEGKLDDISIYKRALTSSEIASLYDLEQSDLVAFYPFNGDAVDESGNGNDGVE